jgi:adenosylhomocysteine nucleosidase
LICISCALYAEAKPLIENFNLLSLPKPGGLKIFGNEKYILQITGVGKKSYQNCSNLFQREDQKIFAFINVGIAGDRELAKGTPVLAHKISCLANKNSFYPIILFPFEGITKEIITQEKVETSYEKEALYDMEAFFLFEAASPFLPLELIHSLKIVSDGKGYESKKVTAKEVETLLAEQIEKISLVIDNLYSLGKMFASETKREKHLLFLKGGTLP